MSIATLVFDKVKIELHDAAQDKVYVADELIGGIQSIEYTLRVDRSCDKTIRLKEGVITFGTNTHVSDEAIRVLEDVGFVVGFELPL